MKIHIINFCANLYFCCVTLGVALGPPQFSSADNFWHLVKNKWMLSWKLIWKNLKRFRSHSNGHPITVGEVMNPKAWLFRKNKVICRREQNALLSIRYSLHSRTVHKYYTFKKKAYQLAESTIKVWVLSKHSGQSYERPKLGRFGKIK